MNLRRLIFWPHIASLFLLRSRRSAAILTIMVMAAVSVLIFLSALAVGVNDAMIRNSVALYSGHISGFNLPGSLSPENLMGDGVAAVLKRLPVPGTLSSGERHEGITLVGVDPGRERRFSSLWKKALQGNYLQGNERAVFVSQPLAEKLQIQVGREAEFLPASGSPILLRVCGVYRTGVDSLDHGIAFSPLAAVQAERGRWEAAVLLRDGYEPEAVIAGYDRTILDSGAFKSWRQMMPDLTQLIDLNYVSMGIVMILVFGIVALGIACIFIVFILKNLREYGIMKAMGVGSGEMTLLIVSEVLLMNIGACILGILVGTLAVEVFAHLGIDLTPFTSHNRYFAVSGVVYPRLTLYSLLLPPAAATLFGLLSTVPPVCLVVRKRAAEILRIS